MEKLIHFVGWGGILNTKIHFYSTVQTYTQFGGKIVLCSTKKGCPQSTFHMNGTQGNYIAGKVIGRIRAMIYARRISSDGGAPSGEKKEFFKKLVKLKTQENYIFFERY